MTEQYPSEATYDRLEHAIDRLEMLANGRAPVLDPWTVYQGPCGHLWRYRGPEEHPGEACPVCSEIRAERGRTLNEVIGVVLGGDPDERVDWLDPSEVFRAIESLKREIETT